MRFILSSHRTALAVMLGLEFLVNASPAADHPSGLLSLKAGALCEVRLDALHPTQFCVGAWEVEQRTKKIARMDAEDLNAYLDAHIMPIVVGPQGVPYLTDHHHLASAMKKAGVRDTAPARVLENFSTLDEAAFWERMKQRGWVYLYERGKGPLKAAALPQHLGQMTDDPYRSLVWAVRRLKGDEKDEAPYAEFRQADYFRSRIAITDSKKGFRRAVEEAARLPAEN